MCVVELTFPSGCFAIGMLEFSLVSSFSLERSFCQFAILEV